MTPHVRWLIGWSVGWLLCLFFCLVVDWFVGCIDGGLLAWLVGWSVIISKLIFHAPIGALVKIQDKVFIFEKKTVFYLLRWLILLYVL